MSRHNWQQPFSTGRVYQAVCLASKAQNDIAFKSLVQKCMSKWHLLQETHPDLTPHSHHVGLDRVSVVLRYSHVSLGTFCKWLISCLSIIGSI